MALTPLALVALPIAAVAAIVLGPGRGAAAVVGCGETGPPRALGDIGNISIDLQWDLGVAAGSGTIDSDLITLIGGVDVDLDADGTSDGRVSLTAEVFNGPAGDAPTEDTYHGVVGFVEHNPAYPLLRDGYGVDYAAETTVAASDDDLLEGPSHLRFTLELDEPGRWPAGRFGADMSIPFTDGTEGAPEQLDSYEVRLDTTGAVVAGTGATVWAPVTEVAVFDDNLLHDVMALGVTTTAAADDPTPVPLSNLAVDVAITQVADVPRHDELRLALDGPLTKDSSGTVTSVGMPGEMAAVVLNDCEALPQQTYVGLGHNGDPATALPDSLGTDVAVYEDGAGDDGVFDPATERTIYADATVADPPATIDVTLGSDEADVDGDGTTDGFDLDGDGTIDRLPWEHVSVHHNGTTVRPDLDAVIARNPVSANEAPLYLAASIDDLPPDASFDRGGVPSATDADGDGEWDDVNGDQVVDRGDVSLNADQGALAFCPKDFSTYPARCTTPAVAAGRAQVTFQPVIPAADADGNLPVLVSAFGPPPADLAATAGDHFPLTPTSWVTATAESTTTVNDLGLDVVHTGLTSAGVDVTGLEAVSWDLADTGTGTVDVQTAGTASFGAEVHHDDLTGGGSADLWSALADAPDDVAVSFDTRNVLRDGDPVELTWDTGRQRTGAAVGVDAFLPSDTGEGDRTIAGSAWIGTGDGVEDGLPTDMGLTVDLVDGTNRIELAPRPPECSGPLPNIPWPDGLPCPQPNIPGQPAASTDPMTLEAGFTTRSEAEEAAGLATRGKLSVGIPRELSLKWGDDGTTISSADVLTCEPDLAAGEDEDDVVPCPAVELDATVVTTDFAGPVGHDALLGVDMIPVPDEDGREFPDFTALPGTGSYPQDWAHIVLHDDPIVGDVPPGDEATDDGNRAGFDLHLAEVAEAGFTSMTTMYDPSGPQRAQEVFNRIEACFEGATHDPLGPIRPPALGLGFYQDETPGGRGEAAATWVDATLTTAATGLNATVETNTPAPDRGGVIGDLNAAQIEYATEHPDDTNLARVTTEDCEGDWHNTNRTLTGRVRRGTESSVAQVLALGDQSVTAGGTGIRVPTDPGVDAALYAAEVGDISYQGLDAALRLGLPNSVSVRQPLLRRCGVGNWNLVSCHELPTYDATTASDVFLEVTSSSEAPLGDLDVEYLTEPADASYDPVYDGDGACGPFGIDGVDPRLGDPCAQRAALHLDSFGTGITIDGTLEQRARDGYLHADIDVTNRGQPLEGAELTYGDDYRPALLGDRSEGGDGDQPLAWLVLEHVGFELDIDATMWAPTYGWNGLPYGPDDCRDGWPGAVRDLHTYPDGEDPSEWKTYGPRTDSSLRPAYLHGRIDLDPGEDGAPAETITVEVDNRIDQPADYDRPAGTAVENWYDDDHRRVTLVGVDTGGDLTDGELWGAFPGLQAYEHQDPASGEFEVCADIDVPLNLEWTDASDLRGAVDLLKATVSILDAEKAAGADVTVNVRERTEADFLSAGGPATVTGVWAHELKTWLRAPLGKDWASHVVDDRMSVGFLDPGDLKLEVLPHDQIELQDDLASGWNEAGLSGNRFYGSVLLQGLFHPSVEEIIAEDKGIADVVDAWAGREGLWATIDERTDTIVDSDLPELEPGTEVVDGAFAHETHHECRAEEKKAEHDEFEPLAVTADGSTFEIAVRWDNQRVQTFLIGRYANGEVRYARELDDSNPRDKVCMLRITGDIQIDGDTGATTVEIDIDVTSNATPTDEQWHDGFDGAYLFDASGNGWALSTQASDFLEATGAVAGEPVTITDIQPDPSRPPECVWYPGDGSRITPGDPDLGPESDSATHTYAFPGTYQAMRVCYIGPVTVGDRVQDPYQGWVTKGTITVAAPG